MTLEAIGSHWMNPDRQLYGRKSCAVELVYLNDPPPGFDLTALKQRVDMVRAKGADVWVRVDWRPRQVLPPMEDEAGVFDYVQGVQQLVAENDVRGIICGNEVNLHTETNGAEIQPWWVARIVYGHQLESDRTDCAYQFAKTARPSIQVLAPPVAPWAAEPDAGGGDTTDLTPPDGRPGVREWESYQFDLARSCYDSLGHVADTSAIQFAIHTYGRVGDGTANGGAREPWTDVRNWENSFGAQWGSRWLQDAIYYCRQGRLHSPYAVDDAPLVLISEANTLTDGQYPQQNYPAGWWKELAYYANTFPNVMGLCAFVDQDLGQTWTRTSMSIPLGRLLEWNQDHDELLQNGWT